MSRAMPSAAAAAAHRATRLGWMLRAAGWAAALALLAGVFALYARPAFLVTLVDQVWSCF